MTSTASSSPRSFVARTFDRFARGLETETNILVVAFTLLRVATEPTCKEKRHDESVSAAPRDRAIATTSHLSRTRASTRPRSQRIRRDKIKYAPSLHPELLLKRALVLRLRKIVRQC